MNRRLSPLLFCILPLLAATLPAAQKTLDIYFIDVEGGQATLFVSPSGESMVVDTGWGGFSSRDAQRIAAAAKLAGVRQIDYLVVTHYHADHVGGVPQLAALLPVKTFVDHGPSVETGAQADQFVSQYTAARASAAHLVVKAGEKIPVKGLDITVLSSAGDLIQKALPGAGSSNPLCSTAKLRDPDPTENARSVGSLVAFGKFRILDLGDLTWNKEYELACPKNLVGTVDVYLTTHHGSEQSGLPALVQALHPRVAIMNNGAKKGGSPEAWQTIHASPGIQDIWQLHYAVAGGVINNTSETFIANQENPDEGHWIKLSARNDGVFTVTNSRNSFSKTYKP